MNKKYKDVFEYENSIFTQYYYYGIFNWQILYKGLNLEWQKVDAPTIADSANTRTRFLIKPTKAIVNKLANLIWAEKSKITVIENDWSEDAIESPLNCYIQDVLDRNSLMCKLRDMLESGMALGGFAVRAYADGDKNEKGEIIENSRVDLTYFTADQILPTAWNNKDIKGCIFVDKKLKNGKYYTKLEYHKIENNWVADDNGEYKQTKEIVVENKYFESNEQNILGVEIPYCDVWGVVSDEQIHIINAEKPLFSYFKTNIGNNLDPNSPLGISIFANSIDTIKSLDKAFDDFIWELDAGRKRIIVPSSAIQEIPTKRGGMRRYFNANDQVYEAMYFDNPEALKIHDTSVELRIDKYVSAINALLNILAFQLGLSVGTFSFDKTQGLRTATEVISEQSDTFRFIVLQQDRLSKMLKDTIDSIIELSIAYEVEYEKDGKKYRIADLVSSGYKTNIIFDDSIIQDKSSQKTDGVMLVQNNLMSKKTFYIDVLGWTEERAELELKRLAEEQKQAPAQQIDWSGIE